MRNAGVAKAETAEPSTLRTLAQVGAVVAGAIVALALVVVVVVFGPFAGVRSLFVSHDPEWGTCSNFKWTFPCHDLPLPTVRSATGLGLPASTDVVDSAASAQIFDGSRELWALLCVPSGRASPLADRTKSARAPKIPVGQKPYSTAATALHDQGVHDVTGFTATAASGKDWWALTGTSRGKTYLYVSARITERNK